MAEINFMVKSFHNDKRTIENVWVPYPTIAMGLSADEGSELPMLNLQRVYIISNRQYRFSQ